MELFTSNVTVSVMQWVPFVGADEDDEWESVRTIELENLTFIFKNATVSTKSSSNG